MKLHKILLKNINMVLIISLTIVASGCSKNPLNSDQTLAPVKASVSLLPNASAEPSPKSTQHKNGNIFAFTVDVPDGWQILNNNSTNLELSPVKLSDSNNFINPRLSIFIPDTQQKQSQEEFIKNSIKGTKTNKKIEELTNINKYKVVAYECVQDSAHTEYPCYYAFITTESDFVVVTLSGDVSLKDKLKSIFYNSIHTLKKQ